MVATESSPSNAAKGSTLAPIGFAGSGLLVPLDAPALNPPNGSKAEFDWLRVFGAPNTSSPLPARFDTGFPPNGSTGAAPEDELGAAALNASNGDGALEPPNASNEGVAETFGGAGAPNASNGLAVELVVVAAAPGSSNANGSLDFLFSGLKAKKSFDDFVWVLSRTGVDATVDEAGEN